MKKIITIVSFVALLQGCVNAADNYAELEKANQGDRISIATVQRSIKKGMSSAEVVGVLGSPNMVNTDEKRREVWVYDKISTQKVYSHSAQGGGASILGGFTGVLLGGGVGASGSKNTGVSQTTQKTLTIIIKFDKNSKVRDYSYRTSKF